jgi:polar amino acid transport system substrate-binding protein
MSREFSMDRRAYLRTVGVAGTSAAVAGCLGGDGDSDTIVPGTSTPFKPFEYLDEDSNELVGFDVELVEEAIARTDYEQGEWQDISFDQLETALLNGDIDMIAAALSINEDRQEKYTFTDPYYEVNQGVVVRDGGDFQPDELEDFEGRRVGAQSGTTGETEVEERMIDEGIIEEDDYRSYENYNLAIQDLANGNIDGVMIDEPTANSFTEERDVVVAFTIATGEEYAFAMRPDDDRVSDVNDALSAMRDDGTYDEIRERYIG